MIARRRSEARNHPFCQPGPPIFGPNPTIAVAPRRVGCIDLDHVILKLQTRAATFHTIELQERKQ